MSELSNLLFNIQYKIFTVLTFGWLSYIFFIISAIVLLFSIFALLTHYKLIKVSFIEKFYFIKNFIFLVMIQNTLIVKFWVHEVVKGYNKQKIFYIFSAIFLIIFIIIYIIYKS